MKKYLPKKLHILFKEKIKTEEENRRLKLKIEEDKKRIDREQREKEELRAKNILEDLWLELNSELTNYIIHRDKVAVDLSKDPKKLNIIVTDFDILNDDIEKEDRNGHYINQDCIKYNVKDINRIYYDHHVYAEYINSSDFWSKTKFRHGETFIIIYRFVYSILYRKFHDCRYYYNHFHKGFRGLLPYDTNTAENITLGIIDDFFKNIYNIDYRHFVNLTYTR